MCDDEWTGGHYIRHGYIYCRDRRGGLGVAGLRAGDLKLVVWLDDYDWSFFFGFPIKISLDIYDGLW